jgi:sec-independent protein translocase protein TatA
VIPTIGPLEIIIVLVIVLIIFGPKRLPGLGRSLGTGMREFKDSVTGNDRDDERERTELPPAAATAARTDSTREEPQPAQSRGDGSA